MPLEVRELVIKATIVQEGKAAATGAPGGESFLNNQVSPNEELITACVERVLEIIKEQRER